MQNSAALISMVLVMMASTMHGTPEAAQTPVIPPANRDVKTLVRELGDESFQVREKATREIWKLGEAAVPALQDALGSSSPEQAYRARDLLRKIQLEITPETDPSVIEMVESYFKASLSEKVALFERLKGKQAWRQMLKLYASETEAKFREKLAPAMNGIATRAARELMIQGDDVEARKLLELAPANVPGLMALADFHRSHGTLAAELERAKAAGGPNSKLWQMALQRAAGNVQAAREAALAANQPHIAASLAALAGDPLPWLLEPGDASVGNDPSSVYSALAAKRWGGERIRPSDLEPLIRSLNARNNRESSMAMNSLFMLGEAALAEPVLVKTDGLSAFRYFESLERLPDALKALGLDPDEPDYKAWIAKRLTAFQADDIEDQHSVSTTGEELVALANFLERRGLDQEAFDLFSGPLLKLADKQVSRFEDLLRSLFEGKGGAPMLAKKIGSAWAAKDDGRLKTSRWDDLVIDAVGDGELTSAWWEWLKELQPKSTPEERFEGMLALFDLGPDPKKMRDKWLSLAWKAVESAPEKSRQPMVERISELTTQNGDVANSLRAWKMLSDDYRNRLFWALHVVHLSAQDRWDEAASVIIKQIEAYKDAKQEPGPEMYAYAAAALRRAGRVKEATAQDVWVDKLVLGDPALATRVGNGYAFGCDFQRAHLWWERAALQADPDSDEYPSVLKFHADALIESGRWKEAAGVSEVIARIYVSSDSRWPIPLPFMHLRLQADMARALSRIQSDRAGAIGLLEQCHRNFKSDGTLADFFFPSLRKEGLMKEHDRWFAETWDWMEGVIRKYPKADNTRNTAAWFAARARLKLDVAEEYLNAALAMNPRQSAYLDTMAEVQFAQGRRNKALEWSKLAVNFAPDDAQLRRQQERFRSEPLPKR